MQLTQWLEVRTIIVLVTHTLCYSRYLFIIYIFNHVLINKKFVSYWWLDYTIDQVHGSTHGFWKYKQGQDVKITKVHQRYKLEFSPTLRVAPVENEARQSTEILKLFANWISDRKKIIGIKILLRWFYCRGIPKVVFAFHTFWLWLICCNRIGSELVWELSLTL